jgi:hypothetical protein
MPIIVSPPLPGATGATGTAPPEPFVNPTPTAPKQAEAPIPTDTFVQGNPTDLSQTDAHRGTSG